ncbi:MAG: cob(I)yrinic acid a,c-diamide adenosyltransferase [Cyclobacteriaceae bacterium]
MKIYTKKGDNGSTGLIGGRRVPKSHIRIDSYGSVDELNSYLGLLRDQEALSIKVDEIISIQNNLFVIGSSLAADPKKENKTNLPILTHEQVIQLEMSIDAMDEELPAMKFFVLPGGHQIVSYCHIARCVCRRAERQVTALSQEEFVDELVIQYLNRLSDYLFTLSRWMAVKQNVDEVPWKPQK